MTTTVHRLKAVVGTPSGISAITVVVSVLAGLVLQFLPQHVCSPLVAEGGVVENASCLLYAIGIAVTAVQVKRDPCWRRVSALVLLLYLFLRELDYQVAFTYRSIESIGFYTRPLAPWWQKALAILTLISVALAGLHLCSFGWRNWPAAVAQREAWPGDVLAIAVLGLFAGASEKLLEATAIEEACELGISFVVLVLTQRAAFKQSVQGGVDHAGKPTQPRPQ